MQKGQGHGEEGFLEWKDGSVQRQREIASRGTGAVPEQARAAGCRLAGERTNDP